MLSITALALVFVSWMRTGTMFATKMKFLDVRIRWRATMTQVPRMTTGLVRIQRSNTTALECACKTRMAMVFVIF
jgi:hypothetical protein